jgi:hypothetical protein
MTETTPTEQSSIAARAAAKTTAEWSEEQWASESAAWHKTNHTGGGSFPSAPFIPRRGRAAQNYLGNAMGHGIA